MPRRNYIRKDAYKRKKSRLERRTKDLVKRLNKEIKQNGGKLGPNVKKQNNQKKKKRKKRKSY